MKTEKGENISKHLLFTWFVILPLVACGGGTDMPEEVQKVVFEKPPFSKPVTLELFHDETDKYRRMRKKYNGGSNSGFGLLPVGKTIQYDNADEDLLKILRTRGFVKILTFRLRSSRSEKAYNFIGYTAKMRDLNFLPDSHNIALGHRELKKITYKKGYTAERFGVEFPVYSMTFNYTFKGDTDIFPDVTKIFEGKVTAFQDPEDGKWKIQKIRLSDDGSNEYMALVEEQVSGY